MSDTLDIYCDESCHWGTTLAQRIREIRCDHGLA